MFRDNQRKDKRNVDRQAASMLNVDNCDGILLLYRGEYYFKM